MRLLSNIPHATSTHGDVVVRSYAYDVQWDEAGRLKYDETHGIVQMRYSTLGKLTQLRKSSGNLQTISYDGLGRKTSVVYTRPGSPTADRRDYYASGLTTHADSVETIRFPGGYFDAALKPHYYATDYQGNNIGVFDSRGYAVQTMQYYPYGEPVRRPTATFSSSENRYLFGDKEYSDAFGEALYDQEARSYSPAVIPIFTQPDAHADKTPWLSPNIYCGGNPVMATDPTGCDTINVIMGENGIWKTPQVTLAKGNDVISITNNGKTETHVFDAGEYGSRVIALNLEIGSNKEDETLGVYHVSGSEEATGFYVIPGGEGSTKDKSKQAIPSGVYPILEPTKGAKWIKPQVGGSVLIRGIRFHYGQGFVRKWTDGCFVLFNSYTKINGAIKETDSNFYEASETFDKALGATNHYDYEIVNSKTNQKRLRRGARFPKQITHILQFKDNRK